MASPRGPAQAPIRNLEDREGKGLSRCGVHSWRRMRLGEPLLEEPWVRTRRRARSRHGDIHGQSLGDTATERQGGRATGRRQREGIKKNGDSVALKSQAWRTDREERLSRDQDEREARMVNGALCTHPRNQHSQSPPALIHSPIHSTSTNSSTNPPVHQSTRAKTSQPTERRRRRTAGEEGKSTLVSALTPTPLPDTRTGLA
ncbi:hypothetical protein G7Z17_g12657 [Cylindrodendrum hubeiense]|uniref:Uncharacterized protein n=1 Tax=Cylindrodendrum hubeiense TaxID=595255 RepID=A0A9P5H2L2_9HYPO|nr:hypothetical protein G7Z17_g12657 [Cylindrodendrum hubeiense]